jgi:transposase-like protein
MKRILEDSLSREHPVSITEIAVQNGYANAGSIWGEFPDLSRAIGQKIAQRRKAEIDGKGEILEAALEEDPPLTTAQMAGRLGFGCPGVVQRNFPAQYQALLRKRTAYEESQKMQLRANLIGALAENPAPTVSAVCRRLGVSTSWVYFLHRDLTRAIAARHLRERVESMKRRSELLHNEVFAIVKNMLDRGERPTQARVRKMLSADSLKTRTTLGRFFNEATGNLTIP